MAVSMMGVGGMLVQGVLVRLVNNQFGEHRTLVLAMGCTSLGCGAAEHHLLYATTTA